MAVNVAVTEKIMAVEGPKMAVVFDGVAVEPCHDLATLLAALLGVVQVSLSYGLFLQR